MKVKTVVEYSNNEKELMSLVNNAIYELSYKFYKIGPIPDWRIGNLIHVPRLFGINVGKENRRWLKDCAYEEDKIPTYEYTTSLGLVSATRILREKKVPILLLVEPIKFFTHKHKWGPSEFHYGDFISLIDIQESEELGYKLNFQSRSICATTEHEKMEDGQSLFGLGEPWTIYNENDESEPITDINGKVGTTKAMV